MSEQSASWLLIALVVLVDIVLILLVRGMSASREAERLPLMFGVLWDSAVRHEQRTRVVRLKQEAGSDEQQNLR